MDSERWRQSSSSTSSTKSGDAMVLILDHMLKYPKLYRSLPLRTTYILNSTLSSTADFQMALLDHIAQLPSQPVSLPPSFLSTFIRKTFPDDIEMVTFDQALTALDYMKNLDERRKKDVAQAVAKGKDDNRIRLLKNKDGKVDSLYAKALIGLRRWTVIHECSLTPFHKFNCMAMLNTLFPFDEEINKDLTPQILATQRSQLWKFIELCSNDEKRATTIAHMRERWKWSDVHDALYSYLRASMDVISEAGDLSRRASWNSTISEADESPELEKGSTLERILWQLENTGISPPGTQDGRTGTGRERGDSSATGSIGSVHSGTFYDEDKLFYE